MDEPAYLRSAFAPARRRIGRSAAECRGDTEALPIETGVVDIADGDQSCATGGGLQSGVVQQQCALRLKPELAQAMHMLSADPNPPEAALGVRPAADCRWHEIVCDRATPGPDRGGGTWRH